MVRYVLKTESKRMGTGFTFEVSDTRERLAAAERVLERAHARVAELEAELSEFDPASAVSRFNRAESGEWVDLPNAFSALLKTSARIAQSSGSAFDPSFRSAGGSCLADRIEFQPHAQRARKLRADAHLSFGAIGKGYALDEVRSLLEHAGYRNFRLNAGGSSIIVGGTLDHETPWPISWAWKKSAAGEFLGQALHFHSAEVHCIGVSGDLEKGAHIVGFGAGRVKSAWVSCESAADADALSTALYVLGPERGIPALTDPLRRTAMALIDHEEIPHWNRNFQDRFGPIESDTMSGSMERNATL